MSPSRKFCYVIQLGVRANECHCCCSYRAVFNYRPVNSDELELREGDLIYVLEQCDDGWFVGTNSRNGFFGTFPGNYVKRVY